MKARKVSDLEPAGALADNAERIVIVRLDELASFMPRAADPRQVVALHDMRIAAKRLRYILEITAPCFGPYAKTATRLTKDLQDLLGEIHDCDVQIPEVTHFLEELIAADGHDLAAAVGDAGDLPAATVRRARHRGDFTGLVSLLVFLRGRRELLFARFLELWQDYERKGFRARLRYAVSERSEPRPGEPEPEPDTHVPAEPVAPPPVDSLPVGTG